MALTIRQAVENDWKALQKINNFVFQNDKERDPDLRLDWPFSEKGIQYYQDLATGKYGRAYMAEQDGVVVGYIALAIKIFGYRKSKYIEVENIGVLPEYQSKGVGSALMEAASVWAKEENARGLYVQAFWGNAQAITFYRKNGFQEIGVEMEKVFDPNVV